MKRESMSIKEFMSRDFKAEAVVERREKITKAICVGSVITYTTIFTFTGLDFAFASNGIDAKAHHLYGKLLLIGKWFIIAKGALDTINLTLQGDSHSAKRNFLGYLLVYIILHGLPWAMGQVDVVFKEMSL